MHVHTSCLLARSGASGCVMPQLLVLLLVLPAPAACRTTCRALTRCVLHHISRHLFK